MTTATSAIMAEPARNKKRMADTIAAVDQRNNDNEQQHRPAKRARRGERNAAPANNEVVHTVESLLLLPLQDLVALFNAEMTKHKKSFAEDLQGLVRGSSSADGMTVERALATADAFLVISVEFKSKYQYLAHQHLLGLSSISTKMYGFGSNMNGALVGKVTYLDGDVCYEERGYVPRRVCPSLDGSIIQQVSAGGMHAAAVTTTNMVYTWGHADHGALGRATRNAADDADDESLAMVPSMLTELRQNAENVKWGDNYVDVVEVAAGLCHTLFRTRDGDVYGTGAFRNLAVNNGFHRMTAPHESPIHMGINNAKRIVTGPDASCAAIILNDDTLAMLGDNSFGQFGCGIFPTTATRELATPLYYPVVGLAKKRVRDVALGGAHMLVVVQEDDGASRLYSTGANRGGQLGHGDLEQRSELTLVQALADYNIVQVAAGAEFSFACDDGGQLFAFGKGDDGRLGLARLADRIEAGHGSEVTRPEQVKLPPVKWIGCGSAHAVAMTFTGDVYTWGLNGDCKRAGHPVNTIFLAEPMLLRWGTSPDFVMRNVSQMAAGSDFTLAFVHGWITRRHDNAMVVVEDQALEMIDVPYYYDSMRVQDRVVAAMTALQQQLALAAWESDWWAAIQHCHDLVRYFKHQLMAKLCARPSVAPVSAVVARKKKAIHRHRPQRQSQRLHKRRKRDVTAKLSQMALG